MKYLIGLLLLAVFSLTACTKKNETIEYGLKLEETLRVNLRTEPPSLDWNKTTDTTSSRVLTNIMAGLTQFDIYDPELSIKPDLAEKWESANNAQTWTFHLRKDVKWNDGQNFTAQHVIDGWKRLLAPETASEYAYFLYSLKNAKAFNEGKVKDFSEVGVRAKDAYTLIVELDKPMSFFPNLLTHASTYPIRKDVIVKHGDSWTEPGNIVTLGPYNLKIWEHDKALVLERNESFFGPKPAVKNILGYIITELSTAINLFDAGKLDTLDELPNTEIPALKKRAEFRDPSILVIQYFGFNTSKAPFNDINVRKAFAHAIDRNEIVKVLGGGEVPMTSWVPAGMFGYESSVGLTFSLEKAKEYFTKAGFGEGQKKFPKVTIAFNTNENHQRVAENIQSQLKRNLGVELQIANEEWKVYLDRLKSNTPEMFRMGWQADYPDPDNFINLMASYSANNHTKWGNDKFDKLINKGIVEMDKTKRRAIYSKAQKILVEDFVPALPMYTPVRHKLVSKRVQNYPINSMDELDYQKVKLK